VAVHREEIFQRIKHEHDMPASGATGSTEGG
jgi:sRNA-binding carbon storage regulator CsrA